MKWWYWVAIGMALMGAEIFIPSFTIIWFGLSAVLVGGLYYLLPEMELSLQIFLWAIFSIGFATIWFKFINPRIRDKSTSGMSRERALGKSGLVIELFSDSHRGKVRFSVPLLGADEWEFICETQVQVGDKVVITDFSGNSLIVRPEKS